ncbi:MAG: two-component hybrid sensor and [Actinobacteria bacterium]|nr:MAG: two-component hybrid sensor and [Actinomycetota bacterium]
MPEGGGSNVPQNADERRSFLHVRALMATTGEGLVAIGPDGDIRVFNETAEEMLGKNRGEVVGKLYTVLEQPKIEAVIEHLLRPRAHKEPRIVRVMVDERVLSATVAPYDCSGSRAAVVTIRDDSALESYRRRAEAILASTGDGLIVFDPEDIVTYMNPAAITLAGLNPKQFLGKRSHLWQMLSMTPEDSFDPPVDGSQVREVRLEDPEHRILDVRTDPVLDESGGYLGFVATLHDVTAERDVGQMKNEFVSTVSHELRTPLTSIKGYIDLILDGEAGEINEIQREFLSIVKQNSDRLVELINDMLDISRIESGRIHLKIQPLEMADLIAGAVDTFQAVADQSGHKIIAKAPMDLPKAAGDRDRVGQVLMNFMSNAIKYSPEGGSVTVAAKADGDMVTVSISDQGIGIAKDDQAKLFTKFYRVDSSLTREIGGTGLGLSICKSIIDLLGGKVGVKSSAGKGSTFWFSLPMASQNLVRTPGLEGSGVAGGTVLVVDRDPEIANLVETYLVKQGYDVVKAHTADEAMQKAIEAHPRVITLDVMLNDGDGFDLLQRLKDQPETAEIPVLVLSIVCDEGRSCRLGASEYLEKPINKDRLTQIVDNLVGSVSSPVVLVVDDDRNIVDLLCRNLKAKGFSVLAAYDGAEAMAALRKQHPDLILLDLQMPVMDGYQVIERVKTDPTTKDIPIVVMTAHQIDRSRIDILGLANQRVDKPFSAEDLARKVEALLQNMEAPE